MWDPSEASRPGEMTPPERGRPRPGRVGVRRLGDSDEEFGDDGDDGGDDGGDGGDGNGGVSVDDVGGLLVNGKGGRLSFVNVICDGGLNWCVSFCWWGL